MFGRSFGASGAWEPSLGRCFENCLGPGSFTGSHSHLQGVAQWRWGAQMPLLLRLPALPSPWAFLTWGIRVDICPQPYPTIQIQVGLAIVQETKIYCKIRKLFFSPFKKSFSLLCPRCFSVTCLGTARAQWGDVSSPKATPPLSSCPATCHCWSCSREAFHLDGSTCSLYFFVSLPPASFLLPEHS